MNIYRLAQDIIREAKLHTIAPGEALYYSRSHGFEIAMEGCQPSNSICLHIGPTDWTTREEWDDIGATVLDWLER